MRLDPGEKKNETIDWWLDTLLHGLFGALGGFAAALICSIWVAQAAATMVWSPIAIGVGMMLGRILFRGRHRKKANQSAADTENHT